jgi:hypothetical protein
MTSQRGNKLISVLVFGLVLATAGSAQAQWGYPLGYGSYGAGGYGGAGSFIGFPMYGYAQSLGQVPQTATSFPSMSGAATLVPGWGGSGYGAYHRHRARTVVPRKAKPR